MREHQEVGEPRRLEVAEGLAGELQVRTLERLEVVRELERAAVGGALHAPRDRSDDRQADELEAEEEEQGDRKVTRRGRSESGPEHEHRDHAADHRESRGLGSVAGATMTDLMRDDQL